MKRRHAVLKYAAFVRIAATHALQERAELVGRMLFCGVIIGVFSSLWTAAGESGLPLGDGSNTFVWYLASTEWILMSAPLIQWDLQEAIRRGDVIYQIGRPVSYVAAVFAEGAGRLIATSPLIGFAAFAFAFAFTGWIPPAHSLAAVMAFGLVASALLTGLYLSLGLLAFWFDDVRPVFWVSQKLLFVLGGLMLPVRLYPAFVQRVSTLTPFPAILSGPASFVLDQRTMTPVALAETLVFWSVVTALVVCWMFRRATRNLSFNGG